MDSLNSRPGILDQLVAGIKEKTIRLAENKLLGPTVESSEEATLSFVASAVQAGAQRLEIRTQGNDLILTHNGRPIRTEQLANLSQASAQLPQLHRGLRLHLEATGAKITVEFLDDSGVGQKIQFQSGTNTGVQSTSLNDMQLAKMTTRIVLEGTGNLRRINQAVGSELPEVRLIRRRCFLAPLEITLLGRPLARFSAIPESLVSGVEFHQGNHASLSNLPLTGNHGVIARLPQLAGRLTAISAGVCGVARNSADSGWYQIEHGVARPLGTVPWPSQTWGFIEVHSNSTPAALSDEIQSLVACLAGSLFEKASELPNDRTEEALAFLEQQRSVLTALGFDALAQDQLYFRLRQRYLPSNDPRLINNRLELASSLEAAGDHEAAHQTYRELIPVWESEALNHFDKYRYEEGAAVWQRALSLHEKLGTDPREIAKKYHRVAKIGREQRLGFAEPSYRRALAIMQPDPNTDRAELAELLLGLAEVLKSNRVLTEALTLAEEAQKVLTELHDGKETRELVPVLQLQSEIYSIQGDYARSTEFEQKSVLLRFRR